MPLLARIIIALLAAPILSGLWYVAACTAYQAVITIHSGIYGWSTKEIQVLTLVINWSVVLIMTGFLFVLFAWVVIGSPDTTAEQNNKS